MVSKVHNVWAGGMVGVFVRDEASHEGEPLYATCCHGPHAPSTAQASLWCAEVCLHFS